MILSRGPCPSAVPMRKSNPRTTRELRGFTTIPSKYLLASAPLAAKWRIAMESEDLCVDVLECDIITSETFGAPQNQSFHIHSEAIEPDRVKANASADANDCLGPTAMRCRFASPVSPMVAHAKSNNESWTYAPKFPCRGQFG